MELVVEEVVGGVVDFDGPTRIVVNSESSVGVKGQIEAEQQLSGMREGRQRWRVFLPQTALIQNNEGSSYLINLSLRPMECVSCLFLLLLSVPSPGIMPNPQ